MNYETLETDIVDLLAPLVPEGVDVVRMPESDADLDGRPFANARVTVHYTGSDYGEPGNGGPLRSTGRFSQTETPMVDILIHSRFLRTGDDSLHKLLAIVKKAVLGYMPTDCEAMYFRKQTIKMPEDMEGDLFVCKLEVETTTLAVEDYDTDSENLSDERVTQIDVNSIYGQSTIT